MQLFRQQNADQNLVERLPDSQPDKSSGLAANQATVMNTGGIKTVETRCFHCQEPIPELSHIVVEIDGVDRPMCCHGCKAAAQWISGSGLAEFYQHRQRSGHSSWFGNAARVAQNKDIETENQWQFIDQEPAFSRYLSPNADQSLDMTLFVQGLYCSSCSWLIEKALHQYNKAIQVRISLDAKRAHIGLPAGCQPSAVLTVISRLGYQPELLPPDAIDTKLERYQQQENRDFLRRIVVAGFGMMQVMTYAVATYLGDYYHAVEGSTAMTPYPNMADPQRDFFTLLSLLVATWVVLYAGKPFFQNAWNDLKNKHLGMDVPVALAIGGAYFPSVYQTLWGNAQHVYFDSAVMFVFFLQLGRFLEMRARHRLGDTPAALLRLLPNEITVQRQGSGELRDELTIRPQQVVRGDELTVMAGEIVPFDAGVLWGQAEMDESLLSGESHPVRKCSGDDLVAGSRVVSGKLRIRASHDWCQSSIIKVERLLQQGRQLKPEQLSLQQLSHWFVAIVLILTWVVAVSWWFIDSQRVLEIVLAMLIASCPCAFALAAPVSTTVASHALRRIGMLLCNAQALHRLPDVTHWCFDKTGTLTRGEPRILAVSVRDGHRATDCLQIMASMEQHSEHVIAYAFAQIEPCHTAQQINEIVGKGLSAIIDGQTYYLGKRAWVSCKINGLDGFCHAMPDVDVLYQDHTEVVLADANGWLASVWVSDELRQGVDNYLDFLHHAKQTCHILSGDRQSVVNALANQLDIQRCLGELSPEQKMRELQSLQQTGAHVAMVGDGVNDAPVLRHADVSIALATGSELSQAQADIVLLNGRLDRLIDLHKIALITRRVTRQNSAWALGYNALVLPLAASGLLTPWLAALGMSLSSLLVVLNALRINQLTEPTRY